MTPPRPLTCRRRALAALLLPAVAWAQGTPPPALEVNQASQAELEQLPGLGPALSEQLLATRRREGPFASWDELIRRLQGVGPAKARRWSQAGLRVAGQAYPAPEVAGR